MSEISGTPTNNPSMLSQITTVTTAAAALKEVGSEASDVTTLTAGSMSGARQLLIDAIHVAGDANIFKSAKPNLSPSSPDNLLNGCRVYEVTDGVTTEYYRTFLFSKDNHGVSVGTGSSLSDLNTPTRDVSTSVGISTFANPIKILSKPTAAKHRCAFSADTFGGYATILVNAANLNSGLFYGTFDIVSNTSTDGVLGVGDELIAPAGVVGETANISIASWGFYYVLDEDNIVIYSNRQAGAASALTSASTATFVGFGRAGGAAAGTDEFSSGVTFNPSSLALTGSLSSEQVLPYNISAVEFYVSASHAIIQFGIKNYGTFSALSDFDGAPEFYIPQDTWTRLPFNTASLVSFKAKSGTSSDTLYWRYVR